MRELVSPGSFCRNAFIANALLRNGRWKALIAIDSWYFSMLVIFGYAYWNFRLASNKTKQKSQLVIGQSQGKLFYLNKTKFQFSDVNKKY